MEWRTNAKSGVADPRSSWIHDEDLTSRDARIAVRSLTFVSLFRRNEKLRFARLLFDSLAIS